MNALLYAKGAFPCYEKSLSFIQGNATIELYYYVLTNLCQLSSPFLEGLEALDWTYTCALSGSMLSESNSALPRFTSPLKVTK